MRRKREPVFVKDGVEYYSCSKCKRHLPRSGFFRNSSAATGIASQCKPCHTETVLATSDRETRLRCKRRQMRRARERDPARFIERDRARYASGKREIKRSSPEKRQATAKLNAAVRKGDLLRPEKCSACGRRGEIQGHHEDYSRALDVVWLCRKCHMKRHRIPD